MREWPRRFRAPGRVNLIGGQVDYHEGWVVSLAIDRDVRVRATARDDARVIARSAAFDGAVDIAADGRDDPPATRPEWGRAIAGVTRVLADLRRATRRSTRCVRSRAAVMPSPRCSECARSRRRCRGETSTRSVQ